MTAGWRHRDAGSNVAPRNRTLHHISIRHGRPPAPVGGRRASPPQLCAEANAAATSSIILGEPRGLARCTGSAWAPRRDDGTLVRVGDWPAETRMQPPPLPARSGSPPVERGGTLVLLTATVVLGHPPSLRWEGRATPVLVIASLHRNLSLLAILLLALHIATSVLDPFAGITVLDAIVPLPGGTEPSGWVSASSPPRCWLCWWRQAHAGLIGPRAWRLVHWLATPPGHRGDTPLGTGSDQQQPWLLGLTVGCVAAVLAR